MKSIGVKIFDSRIENDFDDNPIKEFDSFNAFFREKRNYGRAGYLVYCTDRDLPEVVA